MLSWYNKKLYKGTFSLKKASKWYNLLGDNMDILNIKGLGPKTLEYLEKLNLYTIQDLIESYPYR